MRTLENIYYREVSKKSKNGEEMLKPLKPIEMKPLKRQSKTFRDKMDSYIQKKGESSILDYTVL